MPTEISKEQDEKGMVKWLKKMRRYYETVGHGECGGCQESILVIDAIIAALEPVTAEERKEANHWLWNFYSTWCEVHPDCVEEAKPRWKRIRALIAGNQGGAVKEKKDAKD